MHTLRAALQLTSIIAVSVGITFEIMTGAPVGYVLVTGGALVFAISTKLRERR